MSVEATRLLTLLDESSATEDPVTVEVPGDYLFAVNGDFDGATVGLEMLGPDGENYIALEDGAGPIALAAAGALVVTLAVGSVRATVAGGDDTSLFATLRQV